jgi:glycosyltransferase involved in cell wall biosynthesis
MNEQTHSYNPNHLITVIYLLYNDVDFIERSLNSLLNQTYKNFNLYIIDDCSTDGSHEIAIGFQDKFKNFTIRRNLTNYGISYNMEKSVGYVDTKYIMWAGDDDMWSPNFIETAIEALEEDKDERFIVAFGKVVFIDSADNIKKDLPFRNIDFSSDITLYRIFKLIVAKDDSFGYGVLRRKMIVGVKFPIWSWVNKKVAYNNIYPSLLFYLSLGDYKRINVTWYNRLKDSAKINHFNHSKLLKNIIYYWLRRFELTIFSLKLLRKAKTEFYILFFTSILLFINWFVLDSIKYSVLKITGLKND